MTQNGFLHQLLSAVAVTVLTIGFQAVSNGPTGGFNDYLSAHPILVPVAAGAFVSAQNYIKHLLDQFTTAPSNGPAPANTSPTK